MTQTVQFLIDHQSREETIDRILAAMLQGVDLNVRMDHQDFFVTPKGYDFFERTREPADYTVMPSYSVPRTLNLLARAIRERSELILQHSEQLFADAFLTDKLSGRFPRAYNRHVLAHLVWGPNFAEKLIANSSPAEKIWITGNCKIDLARRVYHYEQSLREKIVGSRKRILFMSNFTVADLGADGWDDFVKRYQYKGDINLWEYSMEARRSAIDWIEDVATELKDVEFVIRVHPGELRAPYHELSKMKNVSISQCGELIEDLVKCDGVVMFTSTAVYEVAALGIPYCNLQVREPLPEEFQDASYQLFDWVDRGGFRAFSQDPAERGNNSPDPRLIEHYMAHFRGNSIARTAIAILEIVQTAAGSLSALDRMLGRAYQVIPLVKDWLIKAGYWGRRRGLYDEMADWADAHWENRRRRGNVIVPELSARAERMKARLLREEEVDCLRNGEYERRLTCQGWVIELPDEVDSLS